MQINGLGGNDTLNINVGASIGSDVIPNPITFDGGSGNDLVDVFGAPTTAVSKVTSSSGPTPGENHLRYQDAGSTTLMSVDSYNVEAAADLVPAPTMNVNGTDSANTINYSTAQTIGAGGRVTVDSFTPIDFSNKSNLTISALGGSDVINLNNQGPRPPGLLSITVDGGDPTAGGDPTGGDTLIVNGIAGGGASTLDQLVVSPTGAGSGMVVEGSGAGATALARFAPVTFSNLERLTLLGQSAELDQMSCQGTAANDTFEMVPNGTTDSGAINGFSSGPPVFGFVPIQYSGFAVLNLNGNDGSDLFNITPSPNVTVNVNGGNPTPPASPGDTLNVNTSGTTGFSFSSSNTPSGMTGSFTFGNRMPVNFQQIESTGPPSVSIADASVVEPVSGTVNASFSLTLSAASTQTVTVDYFTSDGTANAPTEYQSVAGTLTFLPGQTIRTISVPVLADSIPEGNETFFVNLTNPNNATIATTRATGTIIDDDGAGIFQFSAATASVAENAVPTSVNLTILRTGNTSGGASVRFETSDGTASQKNKYTFGSGTVQFGPGDTSKNITVLLINEAFVEGPQTFQVTLSNPSINAGIGNPSTATVTITDDDLVPGATNPIDDAQYFVRQHYLDFLGREADPAGLSFWTNNITSCGADANCRGLKRIDTSAAFFLSIEFQETGGNVIRTQRVAFSRQSADALSRVTYLQFMRDTRQVGQGVIVGQPGADVLLDQNKQAYALQIVNSAAFLARFPISPAAQYVDALYASAAVTPTAAERQAAINAFGAGGTAGRVAALRSVVDSNSVRAAELNSSFVLSQYYGYLRRNPTDAPDFNDSGYQFWLTKLNSFNGDFRAAEMVKAFISSTEYRQRFGP